MAGTPTKPARAYVVCADSSGTRTRFGCQRSYAGASLGVGDVCFVGFDGLFAVRAPESLPSSISSNLPRLTDSFAPPPMAVCIAKPGRACVAGQLWLSPSARSLWKKAHGSELFPFNTVKLTSLLRASAPETSDIEEDDDEPTEDNNARCSCDEIFVGADGRYELQLLPGNYDISASSADDLFVGNLLSLQATEGAIIDHADIGLTISLHLRGIVLNNQGVPLPHVQVVAKLSAATDETPPWSMKLRTADDGGFDLPHLQDLAYDLEFSSSQFRSSLLSHVMPNKGDLTVRLSRAPSLLGVVAQGKDGCPPQVSAKSPNGGVVSASVDPADCTFFFQRLPRGDQLRISATIDSRLVEQHITVPAVGDPPTACLGGPCSHAPAVLLVMPVGADVDALFVSTENKDEDSLGQSMMTSGGFSPNRYYAFSSLKAGQTVRVGNSDNITDQPRITLAAGINEIVLPLRNVNVVGEIN